MLTLFIVVVISRCIVSRKIGFLIDFISIAVFAIYTKDIGILLVGNFGWLPFSLLIGLMVFYVSLILTAESPFQYLLLIEEKIRYLKVKNLFTIAGHQLITATYEEVIWRLIFQTFMISILHVNWVVAILFIAIAFFVWHKKIYRSPLMMKVELLFFSIFLGWIYFFTQNIFFPIIIHFVRNFFVKINSLSDISYE